MTKKGNPAGGNKPYKAKYRSSNQRKGGDPTKLRTLSNQLKGNKPKKKK